VPRVVVAPETGDLTFDVELDLLVRNVDRGGSDDELGPKSLSHHPQPLELGLDPLELRKVRELKDLLSRKSSQGLLVAVKDGSLQVLANLDLEGDVEAPAFVGGGHEEKSAQKADHVRIPLRLQ
jgi:hypothetical protein